MKTTKKLVLVAAALPLVFGTASAYAFGGKQGGKDFGGKCSNDRGVLRQLDLTDEQEEKLEAMRDAKREERKAQRGADMTERMAEMQAYQAQVQDLVLADTFDEAQAQELAKAMVDKRAERRAESLKMKHEMLSILTPEQKAQYKELQAERMQECSEKMTKRMERRNS